MLSFARWRGREYLRIATNEGIIFYDGLLAWRADTDGQGWPLVDLFKRAEMTSEQTDTPFLTAKAPEQLDAPEQEVPVSGHTECNLPESDNQEPGDPQLEETDPTPDW